MKILIIEDNKETVQNIKEIVKEKDIRAINIKEDIISVVNNKIKELTLDIINEEVLNLINREKRE